MITSASTNHARIDANQNTVIGLVLAGGLSLRMGQDKSHLCLRASKQTLLRHAKNMLSTVCSGGILVSGREAKQIHDVYPQCGPLGGIHAVFDYLLANHNVANQIKRDASYAHLAGRALLVMPVDMPNLSTNALATLVNKGQETNQITHFEGYNLPLYVPLQADIFQYLQAVLSKGESLSIYQMLKSNNANAFAVPQSVRAGEFMNVNSPHDWENVNQG